MKKTKKEVIADMRRRIGVMNKDLESIPLPISETGSPMMHGWTEDSSVVWQRRRRLTDWLRRNA